MSKIKVKIFGEFKKYKQGDIELSIPLPISIPNVKEQIYQYLMKQVSEDKHLELKNLVSSSAIANQEFIYQNDEYIESITELAILPPVCGG